jgi:hypothetical protein
MSEQRQYPPVEDADSPMRLVPPRDIPHQEVFADIVPVIHVSSDASGVKQPRLEPIDRLNILLEASGLNIEEKRREIYPAIAGCIAAFTRTDAIGIIKRLPPDRSPRPQLIVQGLVQSNLREYYRLVQSHGLSTTKKYHGDYRMHAEDVVDIFPEVHVAQILETAMHARKLQTATVIADLIGVYGNTIRSMVRTSRQAPRDLRAGLERQQIRSQRGY